MEKNKSTKILGILLAIAVVVIGVMSFFIYKLSTEKAEEKEKVANSNNQVANLEGTVGELQGKIDAIANIINSNNTNDNSNTQIMLSSKQQEELFEKITKNKVVLQEMVLSKDFSKKEFSDNEILKILPVLDTDNNFSILNTQEGDKAQITVENVQKLAQKFFGKNLDVNNLNGKSQDGMISVEVASGYGIVNYELVSIETKNDNNYCITFKYIEDNKEETYKLTIRYENGNITYISLEK